MKMYQDLKRFIGKVVLFSQLIYLKVMTIMKKKNSKQSKIKFLWPKGRQLNSDTLFINGKVFAFIFLSIISAFINIVFISNLTKSGYAIGTLITIPGAVLLGLMSIGLDVSKLLHSIQINSLSEIYRKVRTQAWSKRLKSAKNKWFTVYVLYVTLSIITSMSLSTISIGAGITKNSNTLKQIDEFIIEGEQYIGIDKAAKDITKESLISKATDSSEKDSINFAKTQMTTIWPQIEAYKDERAEFENSEEYKANGWDCEWNGKNASDYWDNKNSEINRLLQNAGYGSVSGAQIKNLNRSTVEARIKANYLNTSKTTGNDTAIAQLNELTDTSNEEARAWVETLNSVGFVSPKTNEVVIFDTDSNKSAKVLVQSALTLLKVLRVDVENDSGDIGSSSKIFMQLGSKIDSAKAEAVTLENVLETDKTSGSFGTTEVLMMSMLLFLSLLVELGINQFSTKTKITRKMLGDFSHYFPEDFDVDKFMLSVYIDDLKFGRISELEFDKKAAECIKAMETNERNIVAKYSKNPELLAEYGITPETKEKLDKKNEDLKNLQTQIDEITKKIAENNNVDNEQETKINKMILDLVDDKFSGLEYDDKLKALSEVLNNTTDKLNNLSNDVEQTKQLDDRVKKLEAAAESIQHKIKKVNLKKEDGFSSKVDDAVNEIEELLK